MLLLSLTPVSLHVVQCDQGVDAADGGHIWTSGSVIVEGFINLRDGTANRDVRQ